MVEKERDKVSIIMPIYNRIPLAKKSIESVIKQTYTNWELLILDDGSTEDTLPLDEWCQKDTRIRVMHHEHGGVSVQRNKGIECAVGEYIAFLDADDSFKPTKLEKQLRYMKEKQYDFCHTMYDRVDEHGAFLQTMSAGGYEGNVFETIIRSCGIATVTVMLKKEAIGTNRFLEGVTIGEDICFWIDMAYKCQLGYVREPLSSVTYVATSTANDVDKMMIGFKNIIDHVSSKAEYTPYLAQLNYKKEMVRRYDRGEDISFLVI